MQFDVAPTHLSYTTEEGEEYMNAQQRAHFEQILVEWKNTITEHNNAAKEQLQKDTSPMADVSDRATLEEEFALALRAQDRERKLVNKINAALERLAANEFGYCERCGVEIGLARLEARPTAELCIDCKELEEKKEIRIKNNRYS